MNKIKKNRLIPALSTQAGQCLTLENWREVGIDRVAYDLTALLMKPGFELLNTVPDLATYTGWQGDIVLNAVMPEPDKEGGYTLRSEYDGSRRHYTPDDILRLIAQLKPQWVLLPEGVQSAWQSLPDTVVPFFSQTNLPQHVDRPYGVYVLSGELKLSLMQKQTSASVQYCISNAPAQDACEGIVYCSNGLFSIKEDAQRLNFSVIDEQCHCPTCKQQLTRAYLHHLFEHTPLLCQRFLIQHNVFGLDKLHAKTRM